MLAAYRPEAATQGGCNSTEGLAQGAEAIQRSLTTQVNVHCCA